LKHFHEYLKKKLFKIRRYQGPLSGYLCCFNITWHQEFYFLDIYIFFACSRELSTTPGEKVCQKWLLMICCLGTFKINILKKSSLKSGGTKDHFKWVKVPGNSPFWKAWMHRQGGTRIELLYIYKMFVDCHKTWINFESS
jgi:hypothetical protein